MPTCTPKIDNGLTQVEWFGSKFVLAQTSCKGPGFWKKPVLSRAFDEQTAPCQIKPIVEPHKYVLKWLFYEIFAHAYTAFGHIKMRMSNFQLFVTS